MAKARKPDIPSVIKAAKAYNENLAARSFLIVGIGRRGEVECLELHFSKGNFQHLTGVKTKASNLSPDEFFDRCIEGKLAASDIDPDTKGYVALKLRASRSIFAPGLPVTSFGRANSSHVFLSADKALGTKTAVLGLKHTGNGGYVPITLLDANIRDEVVDRRDVVAVFSKRFEEQSYDAPEFTRDIAMGKAVDWGLVRRCLPKQWNNIKLPA